MTTHLTADKPRKRDKFLSIFKPKDRVSRPASPEPSTLHSGAPHINPDPVESPPPGEPTSDAVLSGSTLDLAEAPLSPWEPFTLDAESLKELHEWNRKHQSSRFTVILDSARTKVATSLESDAAKLLLDLIPDGTVPVGSLVKGLVSIVVYGAVRLWAV